MVCLDKTNGWLCVRFGTRQEEKMDHGPDQNGKKGEKRFFSKSVKSKEKEYVQGFLLR